MVFSLKEIKVKPEHVVFPQVNRRVASMEPIAPGLVESLEAASIKEMLIRGAEGDTISSSPRIL